MKIVSFASLKGGVAKTTTCCNLGAALAHKKHKVLIVDLDHQSGATHSLSKDFDNFPLSICDIVSAKLPVEKAIYQYSKYLHFIPSTKDFSQFCNTDISSSLKQMKEYVSEYYDFLFFDLAPSINEVSIASLSYSNFAIIPVYSKGGLSILGVERQLEMIEQIRNTLNPTLKVMGILAAFVDRTKMSREVVEYLKSNWPEVTYQTFIRENTSLSQASSLGKTIFDHAPKSNGSKDYKALAKEFLKRL